MTAAALVRGAGLSRRARRTVRLFQTAAAAGPDAGIIVSSRVSHGSISATLSASGSWMVNCTGPQLSWVFGCSQRRRLILPGLSRKRTQQISVHDEASCGEPNVGALQEFRQDKAAQLRPRKRYRAACRCPVGEAEAELVLEACPRFTESPGAKANSSSL